MRRVLVLRPEPGAGETAARAAARGLEPVVAPLFEVRPLPWAPPEGPFDAVLLTSANAARTAGEALGALTHLPCFAVGEATAQAARTAGFAEVLPGRSDGAAAVAAMADEGVRRALHLCGREHIPLEHDHVTIERRIVYAADAVRALPRAAWEALPEAVALLHSPRASRLFAELLPERGEVRIAALSPAVADAAGGGWAAKEAAARPTDEALLELAARLCNIEPGETERN